MIKVLGSQYREPIADTDYRIVATWPQVSRGCVVLQDADGKRELWARNDHFAGYVVAIHGVGYEFVRSLS